MNIKNILLIIVFISSVMFSRTKTWGLDLTAQAQDNSGQMIGISDYIKLKMQDSEPFEDCGIDRCCDKFETGNLDDPCFEIENPNYIQGDDPNGDNYDPLTNTGYERNGKWDGDIYNDSNQDCSYNGNDFNNVELDCENFEDEDTCLDNECNWNSNYGCYYCIHLETENSCLQNGCYWDEYDGCNYNEAFIDRVGHIGFTFGPDGIYTPGEIYYNLNENSEIDESLNNYYPECRFEEGGTDGWRQGEDEFDIPAPMDGHTNIKFAHLDWMNQIDVNGNTCCMEGIFFSVDKKSWKDYDEVAHWDIYGNTWQLGNIDRIKFTWDTNAFDSLYWVDDNAIEHPYEVYIFADCNDDDKFNSLDYPCYVNMNNNQFFPVDQDFLVTSGEGAKISIVIGECALEGTDPYIFDNDGDGWASSNCLDCPKEFCPGSYTGEYYSICKFEECIENPSNQLYINCPDDTFTKQRILNVRSMDIDIENNSYSNADTSYAGSDGENDKYLSVCKYNTEVKFSELNQIQDEFEIWGNEPSLFLDHICDIEIDNDCQSYFDGFDANGDSLNYYINTNSWVQKWYKVDEIDQEDANDNIYCETNAVDDCNICATTDVIGICEGTEDVCSSNLDCLENVVCISDGEYEDFNEDLDCHGICFGPAEIDDCGICQDQVLNGNFTSTYENFIEGPNVDCNGECEPETPVYELKQLEGDVNYGKALLNSCGICTGGNTLHPKWDCNQFNQDQCEDILNCDENDWCTTDFCEWNNSENQCNKISDLFTDNYNGIDECGVCPSIQYPEPFFDEEPYNEIWDEGEEFLDLINDGIFTQLNNDYFYQYDCWDDVDGNGQWDDGDEYIDTNLNGQWDPGEPVVDPGNDGYTPAEPLKLPGECIQIDTDYTYTNGPNCDGECFKFGEEEGQYTLYSDAFLDDCSDCSCLEGIINDENSFCNSNHLPNAGDSDPEGTFEYDNDCIETIFYNANNNSIQNFTALSNPISEINENEQVILEWEYNPELYISDIRFKILKLLSEDSSWEELDTIISNVTCNVDENNNENGTCSSNGEVCLLSNNGNDCNIIYTIDGISVGYFAIKLLDSYDHESEIQAEADAVEFYNIDFDILNGNNLISFSALPEDRSLNNIFYPIQDYVTGIIGPGIASSHIGNGNWVGVITEIDPLIGYWLKIEYGDENGDGFLNDTLDFHLIDSYPVHHYQPYSLQSGANLISFLGTDNSSINDAINIQQSKYFRSIIGSATAASHQDFDNDEVLETWVGNLETLNLQKGYWIILDLDECTTEGENAECSLDNNNKILEFIWE